MRYYHGSSYLFPVGFILLPQPNGYVFQQVSDEIFLERYRPANKINRCNAVFLVGSPDPDIIESAGGYSDYIYEVEPLTRVEQSDLQWYTLISIYLEHNPDMQNTLIEYAKNYWSGIKYKDPDDSLFEFRTPAAKIIKHIKLADSSSEKQNHHPLLWQNDLNHHC